LHIILKEGITLIILHFKATLKGVLNKAIIKVFSLKIYNIITKNLIYKRELEEGKLITKYVSIIFTKNRAIINLSLSLKGSL
jgi:hypothetical protein